MTNKDNKIEVQDVLTNRNSKIAERIERAKDIANTRLQSILDKEEQKSSFHYVYGEDAKKWKELKDDSDLQAAFIGKSLSETVSTSSHLLLVPQIIMGEVMQAEEAHTVAANYFRPINLQQGTNTTSIVYPIIGTGRASEVGEGGEFPIMTVDVSRATAREIRVRKIGIQVNFTDEAIKDSPWDFVSIYTQEAGRAMARYKEYWAFKELQTFGHTTFDNDLAGTAAAWTTGRDQFGTLNSTLSFEDFIQLFKAQYMNGAQVTDILAHPLLWFTWQQTAIYGGLGYNDSGSDSSKHGTPFGFDISGEIPHRPKLVLAPELPFDYRTFKTDIYALDASMVGINLIKEGLSTSDFDDFFKEVRSFKIKERYALAVVNEGRGIAVARNIVAEPSFPFKVSLNYTIT